MRLPTISPASLAAILALSSTISANWCTIQVPDGDSTHVLVNVNVEAQNVYDIAGVCGGLWDNLHGRGCVPSNTYCGGIESTHILGWRFTTGIGCTAGQVQGAWWEATKNKFGAIHCTPSMGDGDERFWCG